MKVLLSLVGAALLGATAAYAQAPTPPAAPPAVRPAAPAAPTVTLRPDVVKVHDILRSIAAQSGQRVLVIPEVSGEAAVSLNAVPVEIALTAVTKATGNTWSRLTLPADRAKAITAEEAAALVAAADALARDAVSVRTADGHDVTTRPAAPAPIGTSAPAASPPDASTMAAVYLVQTTRDVAEVRAERAEDEAKEKAAAYAANTELSPDVKEDPDVVNTYAAMRRLSPDQLAVLTREFIMRTTPDERKALEEAMAKQREQMRERTPQQ